MTDEQLVVGVAHLGIRVSNLEDSRRFYETLGFTFVAGPMGPEPVAIMTHPCGVDINFILNAPGRPEQNVLQDVPEKHPGYTHVALAVADLDRAVAHLGRAGVSIKSGPMNYPGGARGLFLRDPDLNTVELYQHAPHGDAPGST